MEKYKYNIYDYSVVGIPKTKAYCMRQISSYEWEALKRYFKPEEIINKIREDFKNNWYKDNNVNRINPNVLFYFAILTPEKTYEFHETSC